jgi:ABC-type multidrug transport system ATPase subunit
MPDMKSHSPLPSDDVLAAESAISKGSMSAKSSETKSMRFKGNGLKEATLVWQSLSKFVDEPKGYQKHILTNVSGSAKPGEAIALMGPSGSGKTTLLNILGGRGLQNVSGSVFINNVKFQKSMRKTIAYVLQEDIFFTELTVREQLTITSHLRLPSTLTNEEKAAAVNRVICVLRIEKCSNTKIMLISGGEKKRCNIGSELLTNPNIILLDEPTVSSSDIISEV